MSSSLNTPTPKPIHPEPVLPHVRIAIPAEAGRLHAHFGGARQFAIVDADAASQTVLSTTVVSAPPHQPGLLPRWLAEQGVQTVIAAGIGQRALAVFAHHDIAVRGAQPNTPVQELVGAFLRGELSHDPEACHHHDHEHSHDHDHHGPH
jgi:predicted Fe-Mo cluster-binding NifX family protein